MSHVRTSTLLKLGGPLQLVGVLVFLSLCQSLAVFCIQICFVLTMTMTTSQDRGDKGLTNLGRLAGIVMDSLSDSKLRTVVAVMFRTEIWALVVTVFMQDIPFLIIRLYAMFA